MSTRFYQPVKFEGRPILNDELRDIGDRSLESSGSSGTAEQIRDKGQDTVEMAKDAAGQAGQETKKFMNQQIDQRTTQVGERVSSTAEDLRSIGQELRNKDKEGPAKLAEQVADRVEQVADYMKSADADRLLRDSENFGRQRPWAVIVGGLSVGFGLSRFLKASSSGRLREATTSTPEYPPPIEHRASTTTSGYEATPALVDPALADPALDPSRLP